MLFDYGDVFLLLLIATLVIGLIRRGFIYIVLYLVFWVGAIQSGVLTYDYFTGVTDSDKTFWIQLTTLLPIMVLVVRAFKGE